MTKYREIQFLPEGHPLRVKFFKELLLERLQEQLDEAEAECSALEDEMSMVYFNHYVAGDK